MTIIKSIPRGDLDKKWNWLARDKDGELYLYVHTPIKLEDAGVWAGQDDCTRIHNAKGLDNIKWTDEEPTKIEA